MFVLTNSDVMGQTLHTSGLGVNTGCGRLGQIKREVRGLPEQDVAVPLKCHVGQAQRVS